MPRLPHERMPHEEVLERLERIEESLRRIEEGIKRD